MSALSPEARALIEAAREQPGPGAKAAIKAQVLQQVASGAGAAPAAAAKGIGLGKLLGGGALTVGLLAGALSLTSPAPSEAPVPAVTAAPEAAPPAVAPAVAPPVASAPDAVEVRPVAPEAPPAPAPRARRSAPSPQARPAPPAPVAEVTDAASLAEEARLMTRVRRALRDHEPAVVLELAAEHAQRFPAGALVAERLAAEALAHCAQGDQAAGRAARARLFAQAPGSVHLPRVDAACAEAPPPAQQPDR
jgi:hypothetical protein